MSSNFMKRDLWCGIFLLALIPLMMLWQSGNSSKGTSKGFTVYNGDQFGGVVTEFLFDGHPEALDPLCDYMLIRDKNPALAEAWLENIVLRCGENFYTHLARGRLLAFHGDLAGAKREFAAAGTAVPDAKAQGRLDKFMREAGL